jgi:hypothetical protein
LFISLAALAALISVMAWLTQRDDNDKHAEANLSMAPDAWIESFSVRGYRPMLRLAARSGEHCLKTGDLKRYRRIQRALLREYLRSLAQDFHRLHAIAAEKNLAAGIGDAGLPMTLFEQQIGFIFHMWSIEARLLLHALIPHRIDLAPLLANVETLATDTRALIRPPLRFRKQIEGAPR